MSSQKVSTSRHGQGHGRGHSWSVFDMVKPFPPTPNPDSLMADIDAAIAASEHAHATAFLRLSSTTQQQEQDDLTTAAAAAVSNNNNNSTIHDARLADEAYKAACAALASGRHDAAVRSLRIAIASCPPDKTSALSKLRSLMAIAESQQHKQKQQP